MRVKPVPTPPNDIETLTTAQRAIPLVPASEPECCARLLDRLGLDARDQARTWLTFLRGLGLVNQRTRGYVRTNRTIDQTELAAALLDGVYGARELLGILETADTPLPEAAVFAEFEPHIPQWERHHTPAAWRDRWQKRVSNLLGWLALVDRVESTPNGYRPR